MTGGRDNRGRFAPEPSSDRGRGIQAASANLILDPDLHRIVMETANLAVSIPRGRGRRVVTMYEAQIRKLATGKVHRRAAVMDFIRLVQEVAAAMPQPVPVIPTPKPPAIVQMEEYLETLRATAASPDATQRDRNAAALFELLADTVFRRLPR